MSQYVDGNYKTFTSGEALAIYRRVKLSAGTVVYADAGDPYIGITQEAVAITQPVNIRLRTAAGTCKVTAAGTFSAAAQLYGADDGKVDDVAAGQVFGIALEAATAANDILEAVPAVDNSSPSYDIVYGPVLSGGSEQDIDDDPSATQNYAIGTRRVTPDGEEFHYACAGMTLNPDLAVWSNQSQCVSYGIIAATSAKGATSLTLTVGATDGPAGDGVLALNYLVGGRVVVFPHSDNSFVRTITGNTAVAASGGTTVVTLSKAIPVAATITVDHAEAMASPYADVRTGNAGGIRPFLGQATVVATVAAPYHWIHTSGIMWLAPQAEVGTGAHDNEVVFRHDGSLDEHDYSDSYNTKAQHAGFVLTRAAAGTQGAPFVKIRC